ncbi:MAG: SCO family protein [Acidobacteria bacterium]|nr:SCO family protein [Acidobacteriota bacterium]MBI3656125.1 SCO family protein [Acidobacteriota bacterium]
MNTNSKGRSRTLVITVVLVTVASALGMGFVLRGWWAARNALPVFGSVPDFALIERSGRVVRLSNLADMVWVVDFIFTRCQGPCPIMTAGLAQLQRTVPPDAAVRWITITVDPDYDTPAVLTAYADRFSASQDRWWFLTGKKEAIYGLATDGFHLGVRENPVEERLPSEGPFLHSTRLVLVDKLGRIRGYYDSEASEGLTRLQRDLGRLLGEKTS